MTYMTIQPIIRITGQTEQALYKDLRETTLARDRPQLNNHQICFS